METVALHGPRLGIRRFCRALALPRATYYRQLEAKTPPPRPTPARALTVAERQAVLDVLHEPRFVDQAPAEIYARLLDEKRYLCSERTMYRDPRRECRGTRAARAAATPCVQETGAAGDRAEPGVELGHHETARAGEVDVLLLVRAARHLQPLRGRLDGRASRERDAREEAHRGGLPATGNRAWSARHPCRPWTVDDIEDHRPPLRRARRHAEPLAAERLQRQPVLRGAVQDAQVPARLSRRFGIRAACAERTAVHSSTGTTASTATAGSACSRHTTSTTVSPTSASPTRARVLNAAYAAHPERFPAGAPVPAPPPSAVWINPPTLTSSNVEEAH